MPRKRLSRAESRARTRERLLDAAAAQFVRHGFAGASIDEIAAAAGYTKGAFYANFKSKEDVVLALMERNSEQSAAARHQFLARDSTPGELLEAAREHTKQHGHDWDWLVLGIEFKLAASRDPKLRSRFATLRRRMVAAAVANMKEFAKAAGPPPGGQAEMLCTAFEALIEGLALLHKVDGDAVDPAQVDAILDLFVDRMLSDSAAAAQPRGVRT